LSSSDPTVLVAILTLLVWQCLLGSTPVHLCEWALSSDTSGCHSFATGQILVPCAVTTIVVLYSLPAPPPGMDFRWGGACCPGTMQIHSTS